MKLAEWMQTKSLSDADLAIQVNRARTTVGRWRKGQTRPDWEALQVLRAVTSGKVTANDFASMEAAE